MNFLYLLIINKYLIKKTKFIEENKKEIQKKNIK